MDKLNHIKAAKLNSINEFNVYNDISFDVILRGPLLIFLFGLTFALIIFVLEIFIIMSFH